MISFMDIGYSKLSLLSCFIIEKWFKQGTVRGSPSFIREVPVLFGEILTDVVLR